MSRYKFFQSVKGTRLSNITVAQVEVIAKATDTWTKEVRKHTIREHMLDKAAQLAPSVHDVSINTEGHVTARVRGNNEPFYDVTLCDVKETYGTKRDVPMIEAYCTCPHKVHGHVPFCKHTIAALLSWISYRKEFVGAQLIQELVAQKTPLQLLTEIDMVLYRDALTSTLVTAPSPDTLTAGTLEKWRAVYELWYDSALLHTLSRTG